MIIAMGEPYSANLDQLNVMTNQIT